MIGVGIYSVWVDNSDLSEKAGISFLIGICLLLAFGMGLFVTLNSIDDEIDSLWNTTSKLWWNKPSGDYKLEWVKQGKPSPRPEVGEPVEQTENSKLYLNSDGTYIQVDEPDEDEWDTF